MGSLGFRKNLCFLASKKIIGTLGGLIWLRKKNLDPGAVFLSSKTVFGLLEDLF